LMASFSGVVCCQSQRQKWPLPPSSPKPVPRAYRHAQPLVSCSRFNSRDSHYRSYQYRTQFDRTNRQFDRRKEPITAFALHCTDRSELPETSWLYLDLGGCRSASAWVRCDTDFLRGVINVRCQRVPAIRFAPISVAMPSLGTCVSFRRSLLAPSCQVPPIDSVLVLQASDRPPFVMFWPAGERGHLGGHRVPSRAHRHWTYLPC
jgi:hypothetical protein